MYMQLRRNSTILGFLKAQKMLQIFIPHLTTCKNWKFISKTTTFIIFSKRSTELKKETSKSEH